MHKSTIYTLNSGSMSIYIQNIECMVPETFYSQSFIAEKMKGWIRPSLKTGRYLKRIYKNSGINKRHSMIGDLNAFFKTSRDGTITTPTTKVRNELFADTARHMYVDLARKVIEGCDNTNPSGITHIITISCTGFYNPGPDFDIIEALGLVKSVQRFNIGFMGCYGAFPALRLANAICQSDPEAVVLIVAVELCTLHTQLKDNLDSILAGSIFADGGAAAVISAKTPASERAFFEIMHFESTLIQDSKDEMAWTIGDNGFEMVLSQNISKIISSSINSILIPMLKHQGLTVTDIDHWAVHPGGKTILDKVESTLNISGRIKASRDILRQYGNMSSATILFVLKEILETPSEEISELVLSMAFGPGLTVEVGFLTKQSVKKVNKKRTELTASAPYV